MNIPKHLLNLIISQEWAIDVDFGLNALHNYLFNLNSGVDFAKLRADSKRINFYSDFQPLNGEYNTNSKDLPEKTVAKLNLSGVMRLEDGLCSQGVRSLTEDFYSLYNNASVAGILLVVDSGGGDPQAGAELNSALADKNKPVIVRYTTMGSAAYLGVLNATEIHAASEFAKAGSIGAYASISKEFLEEYKSKVIEIYSDLSEDKNDAWRAALEGNFAKMLSSVNVLAKNFRDIVAQSRDLRGDEATIEKTLSGGMFAAEDAKNRGLIDMISTQNKSIKRILSHI